MLLYWCPHSPAAEGWMLPRFPPATVTSRHPSPYPPPASPCSPNTLHQQRPLRHVFNNIETPKNLSVPSLRAHVELPGQVAPQSVRCHLCPGFLFNKAFVPLVLEFGGLKECGVTVYAMGLHARQSRPQRKEQANASRVVPAPLGPACLGPRTGSVVLREIRTFTSNSG